MKSKSVCPTGFSSNKTPVVRQLQSNVKFEMKTQNDRCKKGYDFFVNDRVSLPFIQTKRCCCQK